MTLTETHLYEHALTPGPNQTQQWPNDPHQVLASANHKLVLATATLSGLSEHANNNPATAGVQFSEITKGGANQQINSCVIQEQDKHVSELKWTFKATNCWAHAVILIQCYD
jgi:hypothetical protein